MSLSARYCLIATAIFCLISCAVVNPAQAGTLSRLRDKYDEKKHEREQSQPREAKPPRSRTKQETSKSSSWAKTINMALGSSGSKRSNQSAPQISQTQTPGETNLASPVSRGKLDGVSANVRKDAPSISPSPNQSQTQHGRQPSVHNSRGSAHYRPASRPRRSPYRMGLHFGSALYPTYGPAPSSYTVIEEHYYGDPAIVQAPAGDPSFATDSYVLNTPPAAEYPPNPETFVEPAVVNNEYVASSFETPIETMLKPWNVRLGIEYFGAADDNLSQFGFDFLANATAGFGIDTDIRMLREQGMGFRDHLWLGDVNLVYELFPSEYVRPRVGIGLNWLTDSYGSEAGLNLTVGADVQLLSRVVLTGEGDFGTLGDSDFFHVNATIGLQQSENVEWYAGYDYIDIGGVRIESIVGGLRFRF
jgi:hypothetical protein